MPLFLHVYRYIDKYFTLDLNPILYNQGDIMDRKHREKKIGLGEIYFIRVGDLFKIGATRDLYGRFRTIQVCNPTECVLIHSIKTNDMKATEKLFHSLFSRHIVRGEWFTLSDIDIAYIKRGKYSKTIMDSIGVMDDNRSNLEIVGNLLAI